MKKFLISSLIVLVLLLAVFAALPTLISTPRGTQTALRWINANTKGHLSVDKVTINWLSGQRLENVVYEDANYEKRLSVALFKTETPLLYLLFGGRALVNTEVDTPFVKIPKASDTEKVKKSKKSNRSNPLSHFRFEKELAVKNGTLIFTYGNLTPITVSNIFVNRNGNHLILKAATSQGNTYGSLNVDALMEKNAKAKITVEKFPVALLDALFDSKLYTTAIGSTLNLNFNLLQENSGHLSLNGTANSANLNALIDGSTQKGLFVLNPKTVLNFSITPGLFKQLIDEKKRGDWELASKTNLIIKVEQGIFNLKKKFELKNLNLKAHAAIDRAELHHSTLGSYSLKKFDSAIVADQTLKVTWQGDIQGKESSQMSGQLNLESPQKLDFSCNCKNFPVSLLELASVQIADHTRFLFGNSFDLDGSGSLIKKQFDSKFAIHSKDIQLNGTLSGLLQDFSYNIFGKRKLQGKSGKLIGDEVNFALNGVGKYKDKELILPVLKGNVYNPNFTSDIRGQIGEEGKPFSLSQVKIDVSGHLKKLPSENENSQSNLQNGTFYVKVDGSKNSISSKIDAKGLDATINVKNFIEEDSLQFDKADITFLCDFKEAPLALISPLIAEDIDLRDLVGKTVSLNAKGHYSPSRDVRFALDLNAKGVGFATNLSLTMDENRVINQNKPSYVYWEITPERFAALTDLFQKDDTQDTTYALLKPSKLELNFTSLTFPVDFNKNLGNFICQCGFVGDLKIATTTIGNVKTRESITIEQITGTVKGENFSKAIDLSLSGSMAAPPNMPSSEKSTLDFTGQFYNFWSQEGRFNRETLTVKGQLLLNYLPVRPITGMVLLDPETRALTQAVLGTFVNAHISGEISHLSGPLTIDVKSSNFKALLPLQLQPRAVYLRDTVNGEISLTPEVSATLLKDINPLFITGAFSDHPIKVYIDPQNFVLPIRPYALERVHIGKGVIDLGKIRVQNGGQVQQLMQFLNAREIFPDNTMEAWFTPIYMNLQNGVATYQRFDALLAGNIHIAMWGSINLINDAVNMTLAIAPTTIYQRFKISGLSKADMFQIQMRGTTKRLELDWSAASSRIAWLVARSSVGPFSNILGGILETLIGGPKDQAPPPPTTNPLPWEGVYSSEPPSVRQEPGRSSRRKN